MIRTHPVLFWYDVKDARKGLVHVIGAFEHREVLGEEDSITFVCADDLQKYDRVLWFDSRDDLWREHVVSEIFARDGGMVEVIAHGALFETKLDFIEALRLENVNYTKLLTWFLPYTRFSAGVITRGQNVSATAWITRKSVYEALRILEGIYGIEFELDIVVDEDTQAVGARALGFSAETGTWRGMRLTRGKNLHKGCERVGTRDVCTALYGYGASFGAYDEEGNATGGFTRRLTFGSVNGGKNYVKDSAAREVWGRVDGDGSALHNVGYVVFENIEKPLALYNATHAELKRRNALAVSYEVEGEIDCSGRDVGLGDVVVIRDASAKTNTTFGVRVMQRTRRYGQCLSQRVKLGAIEAGTRSHFAAYEADAGMVKTFDEALVAAGLREVVGGASGDTLGIDLVLRGASRANGDEIDVRYTFEVAQGDRYRYDLVVRNNLGKSVYDVAVTCSAAGLEETITVLAANEEKLFALELTPTAAQVATGQFMCSANATCASRNVGLASGYASCSVDASQALPLSAFPKPENVIPDDLSGSGLLTDPYTPYDLRRCMCISTTEAAIENVWVAGYIVGYASMDQSNGLSAQTLHLSAAKATATNIVLAETADETDVAQMCAVNLSTATKKRKAVRAALNLKDNPAMLGQKVYVYGDMVRYGGQTGLKRVDAYQLGERVADNA